MHGEMIRQCFFENDLVILANRIKDGYVVFDEEPGTYIVCLETTEEIIPNWKDYE